MRERDEQGERARRGNRRAPVFERRIGHGRARRVTGGDDDARERSPAALAREDERHAERVGRRARRAQGLGVGCVVRDEQDGVVVVVELRERVGRVPPRSSRRTRRDSWRRAARRPRCPNSPPARCGPSCGSAWERSVDRPRARGRSQSQLSPSPDDDVKTLGRSAASRAACATASCPTSSAIFTPLPTRRRSAGGSEPGATKAVGSAA